jgi:hypothetical protein
MSSRGFKPFKLLLTGALVTLSVQAVGKFTTATDSLAHEWDMPLQRNLDHLPEEGVLDAKNTPWADALFTSATGSLLNRYEREDLAPGDRFTRRPLRLEEIQALTPAQRTKELSRVSAAEKFDILRSHTGDYPLATEIRKILKKGNRGNAANELDEQMSFGWAAAATSFQEPAERSEYLVRFPEGTSATFSIGSADVKGIAAYYYGVKARKLVKIAKVGARCLGSEDLKCRRIDPASFHILLTNTIKREGKSFVIDVDPSASVEYRPIVGYTTAVRADDSGTGYVVTTKVRFAKRRLPSSKPYGFFNLDSQNIVYRYTLETNADHEITGGHWLGDRSPEFAWRVKELPHVDHYGFGALKDIYKEAPLLSRSLSMFE